RPDDPELGCEYASVLLLAGNRERHRRLCIGLLERSIDHERDARRAYLTARASALASDGVDPARVVQVAELAGADNANIAWYLHTIGIAEYRAGCFDQAIRRLQESEQVDRRWQGQVTNWLVLGMAHYRLGHATEARQWLDRSVQWFEKAAHGMPHEVAGTL